MLNKRLNMLSGWSKYRGFLGALWNFVKIRWQLYRTTSTTAPHTTDTFVSCEGFLVLLSSRQNIIKLGGKKEIQTSNSFVASG